MMMNLLLSLALPTAATAAAVSLRPLLQQQQQQELSPAQKQRFLRSLEDQAAAADDYYAAAAAADDYAAAADDDAASTWWDDSATTLQYSTCYTDDYGNDIVEFQLCPVGTLSECSDECSGGRAYMANVAVFVSSFLGTAEEDDQDQQQDNNGCVEGGDDDCNNAYNNAYGNDDATVVKAVDPAFYRNCAAYDDKFSVGPYCQDEQIYLGYFWDAYCQQILDDSFYYALYNIPLEYSVLSGYSVINSTSACGTCGQVDASKQQDDGENNNEEQENGDDAMQQECGGLIAYSLPLWSDSGSEEDTADAELQKGAAWKTGIISGLLCLAAALIVMGSFHVFGGSFTSLTEQMIAHKEKLLPTGPDEEQEERAKPVMSPIEEKNTAEDDGVATVQSEDLGVVASGGMRTVDATEDSDDDEENTTVSGSQEGDYEEEDAITEYSQDTSLIPLSPDVNIMLSRQKSTSSSS